MSTHAAFTLSDHLQHTWTDELVGFTVREQPAGPVHIEDDMGRSLPCQVADSKVWFRVDELPAGGTRTFRLVDGDIPHAAPTATPEGDTLVLANGDIAVRLPTALPADGAVPAPILSVKGAAGWMGAGRVTMSPHLQIATVEARQLAAGSLWQEWAVVYTCAGGQGWTVRVRILDRGAHVEVREESHLGRYGCWEFSLADGLQPTHFWTHRMDYRPLGDTTRNLGAIQMPVYSGIWVPDDYYYVALINESGPEAVALAGIEGGSWDYPYANQIDLERDGGDTFFRLSTKAGHRHFLVTVVDRRELVETEPRHKNPLHRLVKHYETPLHKVKDYVLAWDDVPQESRPFAVADRDHLAETAAKVQSYGKFRDYVATCNPDLPGDYTYYHSGTHRPFKEGHWNDPAVLYVTATSDEQRRKQARFLKDVVLTGLARRRRGMLDDIGHVDQECASINLGRGLRPWAALYDFAAAEGAFSPEEDRLAKATFAFFCYKIADPDFWPAEALIWRDDHPKSAHRTHWFPGRQHDWSFYNIDNIPHNFHGDLWSAMGCCAMIFPRHPESRNWVTQTLGWWESELTEWIFPGGAWLESSTYALNSMKDYLVYCRMLAQSHIRDYFTDERLQRAFRFIGDAMGPNDPRIGGRTLPVMGDGSYPNVFCYVLGWMAGLCAERDPAFAAQMSTAWKTTGEYLTEPGRFGLNFLDFLFIRPELETTEVRPLPSTWYHGLGAILRHAQHTPDEIYLFIKAGVIYSHFHEPEGTFQLWWNQTPICDEYGVQYGKGTDDIPVWAPSCHNCVTQAEGPTNYNKGDITTWLTGDSFDYVVVDAPIQPAYLEEGQWIWGFKGEMGPAGWHRRHFLLVKPWFLVIYDDLESPYTNEYYLNIKADGYRQDGALVHYDGRYGTDLEVYFPGLGDRTIQHGEYDVNATNTAFMHPPKFHHQLQLRVEGAPYQDFASVLVPHRKQQVTVEEDAATGATRIVIDGAECHALLFPERRHVESPALAFRGEAAAIRDEGDALVLMQARGDLLAVPGRLAIEGDGPYTATLTDGRLRIESDGLARWLTIRGIAASSATCNGAGHPVEQLAEAVRLYVPVGKQTIELG